MAAGHTLGTVIAQIEKLSGVKPNEARVDLGYRGHGIKDSDIQIILARQKRGINGDKINALAMAIGFNLRKIL